MYFANDNFNKRKKINLLTHNKFNTRDIVLNKIKRILFKLLGVLDLNFFLINIVYKIKILKSF